MSVRQPPDTPADRDAADTVAALRAEVQRLTELLDLAQDFGRFGVWERDVRTLHGRWDQHMYQLWGLPVAPGAPNFDTAARAIVEEDRAALERAFAESIRQRGNYSHRYRVRAPDGMVRRAHSKWTVRTGADGQPERALGIAVDDTDTWELARSHDRTAEQLALAVDLAGIGIWRNDLRAGRVLLGGKAREILGLPDQGELSREELLAALHPDDISVLNAAAEQATRSGKAADAVLRFRHPDGGLRHVLTRRMLERGADGEPLAMVGVGIDLTEQIAAARKHAQAMREFELAASAAEAARRENQAKSQFLSRMSHELRTPLNAVLGFTQLLLADDARADLAERQRRLRHIESAGQHLLSLIDDVLDLSSLEGGELPIAVKPLPLHALVNDTLPQLEALAQRHRVTLHTGALTGVPMADEKRLRQVLLNLLSNAIKYNRAGGEVHIGAEADGAAVRLHITDTGVGMSAEQFDLAFEPFNRLGRESAGIEGTGIGLPIVKALVENMGGSVQVHSRVGMGTRFEVRLPAAPPGTAPTLDAPPPAPAPLATDRPARVLYIEDNPVNAQIVQELVAMRANTTLHIATTGLAGVQQALALDPDLVLVDMQLPDIDGFEVLRRLRALPQTARTMCVMLSANAMPDVIQRALGAGFAAYWTKPLDFARFLSALDELLGG